MTPSTGREYEKGWGKCRECGTTRPTKLLGIADDKCLDDWHQVQLSNTRNRWNYERAKP